MANQDIKMRVQYSAQFDTTQIAKGLQDIKKQVTNANISEELKKQFEAAFKKVEVNLPALEKLTNKEDFNFKDIQALQNLIKQLTKDWENLNKITDQIDLSKTFSSKDLEKINNLDKQIKEAQDNIQKARKELVDSFSSNNKTINTSSENISNALTELFTVNPNEIENKFNEIKQQFSDGIQQTQQELQNKLQNSKIHKSGETVIDYFFGKDSGVTFADKQTTRVREEINEIIRAYREFEATNNKVKMAEQIQKLNDVLTNTANFKFPEGYKLFGLPTQEDLDTLNQIGGVLDKIKEAAQGKEVFFTEEDAKLVELVRQRTEAYTVATQNASQNQKQLAENTNKVGDAFKDTNNKVGDLSDQYNKMEARSKALSATFGSLASRIEHAVSAMAIFNRSMQIVRNAIRSVEDLDAAFTQIAIVSEQSGEQAWKLFDDFNKLAKQYSITTKDLTEGAKLFYQQGLSAADTMKMVEASTISAALGEVTMTEAANTLTAAIQGYNESADVAMAYTDKIAMVGAVSAADFNELSAAMEKTASSAYTAGIDFDHLLGYLGKMIEVTREAPANLGTAMKTIIARFEDMKKDPMAILEDGVSANKVEAALKTIGIALRNSEGEFRELQDVFDELGMKWETLTRNQQAYIATVAAGSRQQSRFLAMMNNYDRTLDLIAESQNSAGAAAKQYATYQDSIAAARARLTATWEKFYSKIVDNDIIKYAINGLTSVLELLSKIPPSITAIGATIGALQLQNFINNKGGIIGILGNLLKGNNLEGEAKKVGGNIVANIVKGFTSNIKAISELSKEAGKGFYTTWYEIYVKDIFSKIGKQIKNFGDVTKNLPSKISSGFQGLKQLLTPQTLGILAITAAITVMIVAIEKARHRAEEAAKKVQELNEKTAELEEELKTKKDLLSSYDELNKKVNRTKEEQKELNDIIKNIKDNYSEAIVYMDAYGNMQLENRKALDNTTESIKQQIEENKKLSREGQKNLLHTPRGQWTEEILTSAGIPTETAKQLLESRNDFKTPLDISSIENLKKSGVYDEQEAISKLEEIAKEYDIYEGMSDYFEQISTKKVGGKTVKIYTKTFEEIAKELNKVISKSTVTTSSLIDKYIYTLDVDQYFDDLKISDPKYSGPVTYLKQLMYEMDPDNFEKNKKDISDFINSLLTIDDPSKIVNITENLKKFLTGEITNSEDLNKALQLNGITLGEDFIKGFLEGIEKNKEQVRQNTMKNIQDSLNVKISNPDTFYNNLNTNQLQTRSDLSIMLGARGYTGKKGFDMLQQIAPFADELNNGVENAFKEGSINGINESISLVEKALENSELSDTIKEIVSELIEDAARSGQDLVNKIFDDAQTEIQQFSNDYKKAMDDLSSGTNVKLTDTDLTSSDAGVYVDPESGELMVSIVTTLEQLEEKRLGIITTIKNAYKDVNEEYQKLEEKGEELTAEERERKKELERQIRILNQQMGIMKNMRLDGQEAGWGKSIQLAKDYQSNLQTIKNVQKTIKEQGFLDISDMESILQLMPQYAQYFDKVGDSIIQTEGNIYTISEQNIENMMKAEKEKYDYKLALERHEAQIAYDQAVKEYQSLVDTYGKEIGYSNVKTDALIEDVETQFQNEKKATDDTIRAYEQGAIAELDVEDQKTEQMVVLFRDALQQMAVDYENFITGLENGEMPDFSKAFSGLSAQVVKSRYSVDIDFEKIDEKGSKEREALIRAMIDDAAARVQSAWDRLKSLQSIDVPQLEKLKDSLKSSGAAAKDLEKGIKAAEKAIEDLTKAAKDLDDLLIEVKRDLADITVDYNPFTDLFEAWEHEWDYYYNIKQLIAQLGQQGQWIDNIISADYTSAEEKLAAYDAKVGNITAKMAANDAYILTLRKGITQNALELEEKFGQYYNVDNIMGSWQVYQKDSNLHEWNDVANAIKQASYELSKVINQQENELSLLEATQDALEQERSAYESILSTVDSVIDSLKDNEDITVDLSGLQSVKAELEVAINNNSVEEVKAKVRELNDYIQELEWQLDLNDNVVLKGIDDAVEDMEELRDKIQDYIDTMNEAIAEQQELVGQLSEVYSYYVDTAISTEQELYNAIVENYQNEINQKKKQYDYLKQLDNDYLNTIKNNISKERQAREDANKQKDYQQNIQRAQLLSMDTSGAYRKELASLNKEIEGQRQDLYDDLVDKQVEALEKEIEKRHELYDMEVAALEERLAYMQENAILLWEMVNEIVASGSDEMMATLENTMEYINSNELAKEKQRKSWELSIQTTFKGIVDNEIDNLKIRIEKGNEYIKNLTEIKAALELNTATYQESTATLIAENESFQTAMDEFMQSWINMTNELTTYHTNWKETVNSLKKAIDADVEELDKMHKNGGSIYKLKESLEKTAKEMYNSFITERQAYASRLEAVIRDIEARISAAIGNAASAIQNAANSIQINPVSNSGDYGGGGYQPTPTTPAPGSPTPAPEEKKYNAKVEGSLKDLTTNKTKSMNKTFSGYSSMISLIKDANNWIDNEIKKFRDELSMSGIYEKPLYRDKTPSIQRSLKYNYYKHGGFADFTGPAWLDGTKSNPEAVLNPKQTRLFESMVSSLERASNNSNINSSFGSSYNVGDINTSINVAKLDNQTDIDKVAKAVEDKIVKTIRNRVSISINKGV